VGGADKASKNKIPMQESLSDEALAAYNGGEGSVSKWVAAHPPSSNLDDFVENIGYAETREYVKIVYANYAMYRQIYAATAER